MKLAAKMAGEWWAKRLAKDFAHARPVFAAAVEKRVLQELRGECYWERWGECHQGVGYEARSFTEQDYDPMGLLIPALAEALPDVPTWKLRNALPNKHTLDVTADKLKPKEGYGNWTPEIIVRKA